MLNLCRVSHHLSLEGNVFPLLHAFYYLETVNVYTRGCLVYQLIVFWKVYHSVEVSLSILNLLTHLKQWIIIWPVVEAF